MREFEARNLDIPAIVLAIGIVLAGIIFARFLSPDLSRIQHYKLDSESVRIFDARADHRAQRPGASESLWFLDEQYANRSEIARQYNYTFEANWTSDVTHTAFVPSVGGISHIQINGVPVTNSVPHQLFIPGFGTDYIFVEIKPQYLQPGPNRFDIILVEDKSRAGIPVIYFGPTSELETAQQNYIAWASRINQSLLLVSILTVIISIIGLGVGRRPRFYFWTIAFAALSAFPATLISVSGQNFLTETDPGFRYIMILSQCILLALVITLVKPDNRSQRALFFGLLGLSACGILGGFFVMTAPVNFAAPTFLAGLYALAPMPLFLGLAARLLVADATSYRRDTRLLIDKVEEQKEKFERQEKALQAEIKKRAILEERQRFTRDMHDGIGGQLLSLLVRLRSGRLSMDQVEEEIQSGLNDLRLVVDSMDHTGDDLQAALTTFRARAKAQFEAAQIDFEWKQSGDIHIDQTNTRTTLNLYRFLQEAVSNALRHSGAGQVTISLAQNSPSEALTIAVKDNGVGFDPDDTSHAGKGLNNLRKRAEKLGGRLEFGPGLNGKGTTVMLMLRPQPLQV